MLGAACFVSFQSLKLNWLSFIGFLGTIKPDQMQALNALFILLLIPLFEGVVYPILQRPTPLKRMSAGMVLAALAFVIAGFVQIKIQVIGCLCAKCRIRMTHTK